MAINYRVSQDGLRIETFPKGILDINQTIDYFDRIKNDKKIKQDAIETVYFEFVTDFKISYVESQRITDSYQAPKATQRIFATIFVCETELAYGIGRMLQTYHNISNPEHRVTVVRSKDKIEDVIKSLTSK